jgi:type I restriction enzyme S subunit
MSKLKLVLFLPILTALSPFISVRWNIYARQIIIDKAERQKLEKTWEQRKVSDLIEDYIEETTIQNQYPVLTSSQQQGIVFQEDYFADRQVTTKDNIGYYVLPRGYFTYRSRSDTDVFVFNRNDVIDRGVISYYYPVFKPKGTDSNFLLQRLNHGIRKQLSMAAEGTGQKVLAHTKFKNMIVAMPVYDEQVEIGTFFANLNSLITLHQRKLLKNRRIILNARKCSENRQVL